MWEIHGDKSWTLSSGFPLRLLISSSSALCCLLKQCTGSKLGKEYIKAVYCHPAYLTYIQSASCKVLAGWLTSWNQDCWEKYKKPQRCRWYHSNGRKGRGTKAQTIPPPSHTYHLLDGSTTNPPRENPFIIHEWCNPKVHKALSWPAPGLLSLLSSSSRCACSSSGFVIYCVILNRILYRLISFLAYTL